LEASHLDLKNSIEVCAYDAPRIVGYIRNCLIAESISSKAPSYEVAEEEDSQA